jgi:hypothetical protein
MFLRQLGVWDSEESRFDGGFGSGVTKAENVGRPPASTKMGTEGQEEEGRLRRVSWVSWSQNY